MSKKNKIILISVFASIALLVIILNIVEKYLPEVYRGDHLYVAKYELSFPQTVFLSEDEIIEDHESGVHFFSNYTGNILQVFFLQEDEEYRQVRCDEYIVKNDELISIGIKAIEFEGTMPHTHSLYENVRADASSSFRIPMPKKYEVHPMWGVTDSESVQNMTITGQPVDDFIKFTTSEGKDYYLWIIDNYVGGDDQESMVIDLE